MTIFLPQLNKTITCDKGENLFKVLKENKIPIASSCGGDGICGKCIVSIESPGAVLKPMSVLEEKWKLKHHFNTDQRLSCQLPVTADLTIRTTYW